MTRSDRVLRRSYTAAVSEIAALKKALSEEVEAHKYTHVLLSEATEAAQRLAGLVTELRERNAALSDAAEGDAIANSARGII